MRVKVRQHSGNLSVYEITPPMVQGEPRDIEDIKRYGRLYATRFDGQWWIKKPEWRLDENQLMYRGDWRKPTKEESEELDKLPIESAPVR